MSISADEQIKRGQYLLLWTGHRTKLMTGKSIRRVSIGEGIQGKAGIPAYRRPRRSSNKKAVEFARNAVNETDYAHLIDDRTGSYIAIPRKTFTTQMAAARGRVIRLREINRGGHNTPKRRTSFAGAAL